VSESKNWLNILMEGDIKDFNIDDFMTYEEYRQYILAEDEVLQDITGSYGTKIISWEDF
tara:strand:- start:157 stop:333 length:177 start_codon:yes stop_codon:yes gene_type:complete